jgi:hypothetical protein
LEGLGWPLEWRASIDRYAAMTRAQIRQRFAAFCDVRPPGAKFAHRACDGPAGSSPSMKWVNPPVALMLHAGVPCLIEAGVDLPGLQAGDPRRVALEGYPGLLARALIGRVSYKADDAARQTPDRHAARVALLRQVEAGGAQVRRMRLPALRLTPAQRGRIVDDARGDLLDAVLCLMAAAWAASQPGYGLPDDADPVEGWIVGA